MTVNVLTLIALATLGDMIQIEIILVLCITPSSLDNNSHYIVSVCFTIKLCKGTLNFREPKTVLDLL